MELSETAGESWDKTFWAGFESVGGVWMRCPSCKNRNEGMFVGCEVDACPLIIGQGDWSDPTWRESFALPNDTIRWITEECSGADWSEILPKNRQGVLTRFNFDGDDLYDFLAPHPTVTVYAHTTHGDTELYILANRRSHRHIQEEFARVSSLVTSEKFTQRLQELF